MTEEPAWDSLRVRLGAALRCNPLANTARPEDVAQAVVCGEVVLVAASMDEDLARILHVEVETQTAIAMVLDGLHHRLAACFERAGISRVAVLKGGATARLLYPTSDHRQRRDVDILVAADALDAAIAALETEGWVSTRSPDLPPRTPQQVRAWPMGVQTSVGRIECDLHQRLASDGRLRIDAAEILDRAKSPTGGGLPLCGPADLLIHACAHAAMDGFTSPLKGWLDVHLLAQHPELHWSDVVATASRWRCKGVLYAGLFITESWFGTPIPIEVWSHITPGPRRARAIRGFLEGRGSTPLRAPLSKRSAVALSALLCSDGWRERWAYLSALFTRRVRGLFTRR